MLRFTEQTVADAVEFFTATRAKIEIIDGEYVVTAAGYRAGPAA